jgi:[acyl-carrier-protein] S-malonyltransferase
MAAVIGLDTAQVESACQAASDSSAVAVAANLNAPDQTVISGDPSAVERAGEGCKAAGAKRVIPLKVSGAFHSPLMEPAVPGLVDALAAAEWSAPRMPVIANVNAHPVRDAAEARKLLAAQLTAPVRWVDSMRAAAALAPEATFIEVGPGSVLTGLLKRIVPGARCITLGSAAEVEGFLA